ncbi:MAG: tetratricopeptide repeat protein [Candidatus Rokuibacteriota bacterium]
MSAARQHIRRLLPAVIAAITVVTFAASLDDGFVDFDDPRIILENPDYRGLGWAQLRWMFTAFHMGHYMPLTWLTLGLDYVLWGLNPAGYHLTSVLFHALAAALLWLVMCRLLAVGFGVPRDDAAVRVGAAVAALVYAVHPQRVESVVWITERRDVLSGVFYLSTILAYLVWVERGAAPGRRYWGVVGLYACALLSKSMTVNLPLVLLALDVVPLARLGRSTGWTTARARAVLREKWPFVLLAAAGVVGGFVGILKIQNLTPLSRFGPLDRLVLSAYGVAFYVGKLVLPIDLSPLYERPRIVEPLSPPYLVAYAVVIGLTAVAWRLRRRAPALLAAWITYFVILVPVLGFLQNGPQVTADRYTYYAHLPWIALLGGVGTWCWRALARVRPQAPVLLVLAAAALVLLLQLLTTAQVSVWRDSVSLWRHAWSLNPASPHMNYFLANAMAAQGDLRAAESHYRAVLERETNLRYDALNNLGIALARGGRPREALEAFVKAAESNPRRPEACANARLAAQVLGVPPPDLRCGSGADGIGLRGPGRPGE